MWQTLQLNNNDMIPEVNKVSIAIQVSILIAFSDYFIVVKKK